MLFSVTLLLSTREERRAPAQGHVVTRRPWTKQDAMSDEGAALASSFPRCIKIVDNASACFTRAPSKLPCCDLRLSPALRHELPTVALRGLDVHLRQKALWLFRPHLSYFPSTHTHPDRVHSTSALLYWRASVLSTLGAQSNI